MKSKGMVLDLQSPRYEPPPAVWYDKSSRKNNGTITGATWTKQSNGGYLLSFSGSGQGVAVPYAGYKTKTITFWASSNSLAPAAAKYALDNSPGATGFMVRQDAGTGTLITYCYYTVAGAQSVSIAIGDTALHFYAVRHTTTSVTIRKDCGAPVTVNFAADTFINPNDTLEIGRDISLVAANTWDGFIGQVKYYEYGLSDFNLQLLCENERERFGY